MSDNNTTSAPIGTQIRLLRKARGWALAELARRAGTSAPTLHRYESGWDRFELDTLRRIAAALDARLEVRFVAPAPATSPRPRSPQALIQEIAPLFWDHDLTPRDLARYRDWVLERVLTMGGRSQVRAARDYFGDDAMRSALRRRGIDARTRAYWQLILGDGPRAPQGP